MAIIVNLYGVPGAGKSTGAAYIFARLKDLGINAELVTEFAKGKVWEGNTEVFKNQAYIFGKQFYSISRCADKVEIIVTDSPIVLSAFYNDDNRLGEEFNHVIKRVADSYPTMNYFLLRSKPYNPNGRFQTQEESDGMVEPMKKLMENYGVKYTTLPGCFKSYDKIVKEVAAVIKKKRSNETKE